MSNLNVKYKCQHCFRFQGKWFPNKRQKGINFNVQTVQVMFRYYPDNAASLYERTLHANITSKCLELDKQTLK